MWRVGTEQVILILLAIVTLALQIRHGLVRQGDWQPSIITIVEPYVFYLILFLLYQFLRVPKLLYEEESAALDKARAEIAQLNQPYHLAVWPFNITDIHTEAIDRNNKFAKHHVFVHPEVHLCTPGRIAVKEYRLELKFYDLQHFPTEHKDVSDWIMEIGHSATGGAHVDIIGLIALPTTLEANRPCEGWLHFITDPMTENQLQNSRIRLFMETDLGPAHAELQTSPSLWGQDRDTRIFKKKPSVTL